MLFKEAFINGGLSLVNRHLLRYDIDHASTEMELLSVLGRGGLTA